MYSYCALMLKWMLNELCSLQLTRVGKAAIFSSFPHVNENWGFLQLLLRSYTR